MKCLQTSLVALLLTLLLAGCGEQQAPHGFALGDERTDVSLRFAQR